MRPLCLLVLPALALVLAASLAADPPLPPTLAIVCKPTESAVFLGTRYHVKCERPTMMGQYYDQAIYYYSIPAADPARVDQALQIVNAAITSGKRVRLFVWTGTSNNPSGCQTGDCRGFFGVELLR